MFEKSNTIEVPEPLTDAEFDAAYEELDRIIKEIVKERVENGSFSN